MSDYTPNNLQIKMCDSGDNCVHPDGPHLPSDREHFYFSQHGNPRKFCKECAKAHRKQYHVENREHENRRSRAYIEANKESVYAKRREYRAANKATIQRIASEKYHSAPATRAVQIAHAHNKRARKYGVEGVITVEDYLTKLKSQHGECWYCGTELGNRWHTDHRVPMFRGGNNTPENIVLCCAPCNQKKQHKLPEEWENNPRNSK